MNSTRLTVSPSQEVIQIKLPPLGLEAILGSPMTGDVVHMLRGDGELVGQCGVMRSQAVFRVSAGKGSRTPTPLRADGFEPSAYAIPPPRRVRKGLCHNLAAPEPVAVTSTYPPGPKTTQAEKRPW